MTALSDGSDPSHLMRADPQRLRAFADALARDGEAELSLIVRRVADDAEATREAPDAGEGLESQGRELYAAARAASNASTSASSL